MSTYALITLTVYQHIKTTDPCPRGYVFDVIKRALRLFGGIQPARLPMPSLCRCSSAAQLDGRSME